MLQYLPIVAAFVGALIGAVLAHGISGMFLRHVVRLRPVNLPNQPAIICKKCGNTTTEFRYHGNGGAICHLCDGKIK